MEGMSYVNLNQSEAAISASDQWHFGLSLTWARGPWRGSWAARSASAWSPLRSWTGWPQAGTPCRRSAAGNGVSSSPETQRVSMAYTGHWGLDTDRELGVGDVGDMARVRRQRRILGDHLKHAGGLLIQCNVCIINKTKYFNNTLNALWLLSECSLSVHWSLSEFSDLITFWPRRWRLTALEKLGPNEQTHERTDEQRLTFLELLSESKSPRILV